MNIEAMTQITDAISFVLVTPEFLSEHTLDAIRNGLRKIANKIANLYMRQPNKFSDGICAASLILVGTIGAIFSWLINRYLFAGDYKFGAAFLMYGFMTNIILGLLVILFHLASLMFFRRFFFALGALLFMASRGVLVWHYLHSS
jgi:hypothetical protein